MTEKSPPYLPKWAFTPEEMVQRVLETTECEGRSLAARIAQLIEQKSVLRDIFMRCQGTPDDGRLYKSEVDDHDKAIAAWRNLARSQVIGYAQDGLVVGYGFKSLSQSAPEIIPPHQWHFLQLDFETSKAACDGLSYVGIRFAFPSKADRESSQSAKTEASASKEEAQATDPAPNLDKRDPGRREPQIQAILKIAASFGYDPLDIPDGGKAAIKERCLALPGLFTKSAFDHAWKTASREGRVCMRNKERFMAR